jgi:hypothetical protein
VARNFKYVGPHDEVAVFGLGVVAHGDTVTVEDVSVADEFAGRDDWEHIPDPERSKAAKKAAAGRDDNQEG